MALVTEKNEKLLASIGERVAATFVQAGLGAITASDLYNLAGGHQVSVAYQFATAGTAAVYSLIKNLLGTYLGNTSSPSWLPKPLDPATPPVPDVDPLPDVAPAPYVHKGG